MAVDNIIRRINTLKALKYLQTVDSATKNDIAIATEISFPTVGKILTELQESGEIISQTFDSSNGGRPAERFAINAQNTMTLGLFLDSNSFEYMICDSLKNVLEDKSIILTDSDNLLEKLISLIIRLLKKYPAIKILSLGVPGSVNNEKLEFMPERYKNFNGLDIKKLLEERLHIPVLVENDINAIASGQYTRNFPEFKGNAAHLYIAEDGLGIGITVNGKILHGDHGVAGEIGFMPYNDSMNIRQALDKAMLDNDANRLSRVIAKIIALTTCLINPSYFSMSGIGVNEELLPLIAKYVSEVIPNMPLPTIIAVDNIRELYFYYLIDVANNFLYS